MKAKNNLVFVVIMFEEIRPRLVEWRANPALQTGSELPVYILTKQGENKEEYKSWKNYQVKNAQRISSLVTWHFTHVLG